MAHLPVCYRYFDCFDSFSGWYGTVVLHVVFDSLIFVRHLIVCDYDSLRLPVVVRVLEPQWLELRRLPPIMGFVG